MPPVRKPKVIDNFVLIGMLANRPQQLEIENGGIEAFLQNETVAGDEVEVRKREEVHDDPSVGRTVPGGALSARQRITTLLIPLAQFRRSS